MEFNRNIIITGGAGFIGSHVVRLFVNKYPEYRIINLDKLTYAGNLANLKDIEGFPTREVAGILGCDEAQVRVLLSRARCGLREILKKMIEVKTNAK